MSNLRNRLDIVKASGGKQSQSNADPEDGKERRSSATGKRGCESRPSRLKRRLLQETVALLT